MLNQHKLFLSVSLSSPPGEHKLITLSLQINKKYKVSLYKMHEEKVALIMKGQWTAGMTGYSSKNFQGGGALGGLLVRPRVWEFMIPPLLSSEASRQGDNDILTSEWTGHLGTSLGNNHQLGQGQRGKIRQCALGYSGMSLALESSGSSCSCLVWNVDTSLGDTKSP